MFNTAGINYCICVEAYVSSSHVFFSDILRGIFLTPVFRGYDECDCNRPFTNTYDDYTSTCYSSADK